MKGIKNMKINKQLFEDVLSGKLKGTFVLRNGSIISSDWLRRAQQIKVIVIDAQAQSYPYILEGKGKYYCYYTENGMYIDGYTRHNLDIIDFIPDTDMKENELTITIPEGYCIDESKSTFGKIVFKKKYTRPRSWEEYCDNFKGYYYYIQDNRDNIATSFTPTGLVSAYKNTLPSKELAEAFLAMMQLMSLREAWIGDWEPDWKMYDIKTWCVVFKECKVSVDYFYSTSHPLSFPTEEMAEDFMNCFKDLLNTARPLI